MQQLALKQRPARRLVFRGTLWLAFVTLVMIALGAGATAADSKHHIDFLIYASIALLIWTCSAAELYIDRDYNRSLPGRLETYLNSNLDQDDYEQLRQAALRHPALRPWISDCIKNGELTYRDAEPLVARINQHLSENPSPSEQPHALLNSQQKLLQLLQLRSLVSTPPCESPAVVTVRSDTSGSSRISVCHADSGDSPIT